MIDPDTSAESASGARNSPAKAEVHPGLEARQGLRPHQRCSVVQRPQWQNPREGKGLRPAGSCQGTIL